MKEDNELVEAKGLYKDDKLIGIIGLYPDDAVAVCFKGKCYVTAKNQKKIYYIAQSWYSDLIPGLQIREIKEASGSDLITPDKYRERSEKIQDFVNEVSEVMGVTPPKVKIPDYDTFLQYSHPAVAATYKHDLCIVSKEGVRDCIGPAIIINPKIKPTVSFVTHEFIHHRDLEEDLEYTRDLIKKGIDPYLSR